jgi:hypothetical protein
LYCEQVIVFKRKQPRSADRIEAAPSGLPDIDCSGPSKTSRIKLIEAAYRIFSLEVRPSTHLALDVSAYPISATPSIQDA